MSSILKALRKLEEEKSRNLGGTPDIARNILKTGPRREKNPWLLPASVAALILAFGMSGYILGGKAEPPSLSPEQSLPPAMTADSPLPAKETSIPVAATSAVKQPPAATSSNSRPLNVPPGEKGIPARPLSTAPLPAAPKAVQKPVKTFHSQGIAEKAAADPLPALLLTGIAFQNEREGRLAVVNDLPVMEGTMIAGARVVEIAEDRVRFDFSGRSFEVLLEGPPAK